MFSNGLILLMRNGTWLLGPPYSQDRQTEGLRYLVENLLAKLWQVVFAWRIGCNSARLENVYLHSIGPSRARGADLGALTMDKYWEELGKRIPRVRPVLEEGTFCKYVSIMRRYKGIEEAKLSEHAGIDRVTLRLLERQYLRPNELSPEVKIRIERALGDSYREFLASDPGWLEKMGVTLEEIATAKEASFNDA